VVLVHGCFWHRHPGCKFATTPASNEEFWLRKFDENINRDRRTIDALLDLGWRVATVWECGLKPARRQETLARLAAWVRDTSLQATTLPSSD
jgi:DNA mismatch endonuclease (patch repair protein)